MDISSELRNASLEVWTNATRPTGSISRIGFNITRNRIEIYSDGEFKAVPMGADLASLNAVGDLKVTMLTAAELDNTWLLLDGHGLYGTVEPYLSADYPELVSTVTGGSWVQNIDVGYGAKDYMFVPDSRSASLVGVDSPAARDLSAVIPALSQQVTQALTQWPAGLGYTSKPTMPAIETDREFVHTNTWDSLDFEISSSGGGPHLTNVTAELTSTTSKPTQSIVPDATRGCTTVASNIAPQSLGVNIFIKCRSVAI